MHALSIRQPYAELSLRGLKPIEYRSRPTRIIGKRFYIYAAKTPGSVKVLKRLGIAVPAAIADHLEQLPTGVIVGTAMISHCTKAPAIRGKRGMWEWHLSDIKRIEPRKPRGRPQPVWFRPW